MTATDMRKPGINMLLLVGLLLTTFFRHSYARQFPIDTVASSITHFTDEDGLPQNSINSINYDEHGFVWFSTEDGLVRFDGRHFMVFTSNNTGIRSSRFSRIRKIPEEHSMAVMNSAFEWLRIKDGKAFVDTSLAARKRDEDQYHENYKRIASQDALITEGLPSTTRSYVPDPLYLVRMGKDRFYLCTRSTVMQYDKGSLSHEASFSNKDVWRFFPMDGHLFYLDPDGGLTGFSDAATEQLRLEGDITRNPAFSGKKKIDIFWNYNSALVLLYLNGSFYTVHHSADGNLTTRLIMQFNIEDINVVSVYYDEAKEILFIGSADRGLYMLKKKNFSVLVSGFDDPGDVFYGQTVYKGNSLLTPQGILLSPERPPVLLTELKLMSKQDRYGILTDKKGFIWMKGAEHLYKLDPDRLKTMQRWALPDGIGALREGLNNTMWIGLRTKGLYSLDISDINAPTRFVVPFQGISCMNQQAGNRLWIGSSGGLFRLNTDNKTIDTIPGLLGMYIRSIYATGPNLLWITTYSNGFFLYDNGRVVRFPVDKDNFLSTAHCIIEDRKGFFWITTNKGLFQMAKKDLLAYSRKEQQEVYYHYYDKENGFNTNEFNGGCDPCAVRLGNGDISLPSLNGLVLFDPEKLDPLLPDNKIFIDNIQLDNHPLTFSKSLTLPKGFKQLRLTVSSPYLGNKKNINFTYALTRKGDTPLWLPVGEDGVISFSNLRSGTYTLSIRKLNGFGKNNYTRQDIILYIPVSWYQTTWFLASLLLLAVLLTYIATRIRVQYIIRNNRLLELKIAERTEKLQQTLDHLQRTQADLQQKAYLQEHLIAAISHDIRTPMKYLVLTLQRIHEGLIKENNSAFIKTAESAKDYISQLDGTVHNLIQYIKAQKNKSYVLSDTLHLHSFVADIIALHDDPARRRHNSFVNEVPESLSIRSSGQLLSIILRNLIDNAVKNTFDGSITISAKQAGNMVDISIWDTGKGMSEDLLKWLNNDDITSRPDENEAGFHVSSGLGLIIVKELATLLQIRLSAISREGEGSVVHLVLPQ